MSTKFRAVLEVQYGGQVNRYTVEEAPLTIGRSGDNDIVLDDNMVSRRHAEVKWRKNTLIIVDLGSSNGILINSTRIEPHTEIDINNGDVITIGDSSLILRIEPVPAEIPVSRVREERGKTAAFIPTAQVVQTKFPKRILIGVAAGVLVVIGIVAQVIILSVVNQNDVREAAAMSLVSLTDNGIGTIDNEIIAIDQKAVDVEQRLIKLEQVTEPAYEWVEYQKTISRTGSWLVEVEPEGLEQLQNDRYKISTLEIFSDRGTISSTVKVTDLFTKSIYNPEVLKKDLIVEKEKLIQQRESAIQTRELSIAAIGGVLNEYAQWDVKKRQTSIFYVSGNGLGWGNDLCSGVWVYYQDTDSIAPSNKPAQGLEAVLTAQ